MKHLMCYQNGKERRGRQTIACVTSIRQSTHNLSAQVPMSRSQWSRLRLLVVAQVCALQWLADPEEVTGTVGT